MQVVQSARQSSMPHNHPNRGRKSMPLQKLTRDQLSGSGETNVYLPYRRFLSGLSVGAGGRATVEDEGVSQQTIKARLKTAAAASNMEIKFHRASKGEVIFEVTSAPERPRRGRRPKSEMVPAE